MKALFISALDQCYWAPEDEPPLAGGVAGEPVPAGGVAGLIGAPPPGADRVAPGPPWSGALAGRCSKSHAARARAQSDAATSLVFMADSSFVVELPLSKPDAQAHFQAHSSRHSGHHAALLSRLAVSIQQGWCKHCVAV
jgi:hypothetical protein